MRILLLSIYVFLLVGCSFSRQYQINSLLLPQEISTQVIDEKIIVLSDGRKIDIENGAVWKFFHPEYAKNWGWVKKTMFFVGPGH